MAKFPKITTLCFGKYEHDKAPRHRILAAWIEGRLRVRLADADTAETWDRWINSIELLWPPPTSKEDAIKAIVANHGRFNYACNAKGEYLPRP